ncbi:fructose-1,6-bisphosphatase [Candidatus Peregrinibacteria bacterium]|nr:MAG: fructose-1,6-bisphosphatase [Candidatus Peregrinibacteria bacterium]
MLKLLDTHLYESKAPDSLRHLINYIARAGKYINYSLQMGDLGKAGSQNFSGEDQLALDVLADQTIMENIMVCRLVSAAVSEEQDDVAVCPSCKTGTCGEYVVAFDPLDGSSLVDANLAIGTIMTIYKGNEFLGRTGREQVAALYMLYGPRTTLVYTIGSGVHEFTLNDVGEFTLTRENLVVRDDATHFAPGNLRAVKDDAKYRKVMERWMDEQYTLRYSGGMTPDVNHILLKGQGIFTYPPQGDKYPNGKLRLLFECNPFAFLMEQAGALPWPAISPCWTLKSPNSTNVRPFTLAVSMRWRRWFRN